MLDALLGFVMSAVLAVYLVCALALAAYGCNCYVMIALFLRARGRQQAEDEGLLRQFNRTRTEADLPFVTTQLPVFNERYVVERLLRAVCAFDYPRDRHEIQVLDDSTDETRALTARLVAQLQAEGYCIQYLNRPNRAGYKAGALQAGMAVARGEYLAIFDADFVPPPDFLRRTIPFLVEDPTCGFVQARWGHQNRDYSVLTMAQAVGIDGHFVVEQSARAWNQLFLNFNGTAGVWRRKAIEDAGGWSPDTITEDLALSYRAQLAGWRGRFLFDVVTPAEIPTNINAFKAQQFRWAKGSIQTARKLLPEILGRADLGLFKRVQAALHLTHYFVHPLILVMTLLSLPLLAWNDWTLFPQLLVPALAVVLASLVAPSALYVFSQKVAHPDWRTRVKFLGALVPIGVGLAVNNTRGVLSALFSQDPGEFVRTPKLGVRAEKAGPQGRAAPDGPRSDAGYEPPLSLSCLGELFMGAWAAAAFGLYLGQSKFLVGPIFLVHAVGFLCVGALSLYHRARGRTRSAFRRAPSASSPYFPQP